MPPTEALIAFATAALIMNISPGPSNLYVMARAIGQGVKGGVVAAMGLAVGSIVHVIATALGLAAIFKHSPTLYTVIKLAGAAYLIYLGIKYLRAKDSNSTESVKKTKEKPLLSVFRESIIVEVTNPKTALFFLALLPQFVVPESGPVGQQLLILGLIVTISAIPCDLLVVFASTKVASWLSKNKQAQRIQERVSGTILFGMGAYIVADEAVTSVSEK